MLRAVAGPDVRVCNWANKIVRIVIEYHSESSPGPYSNYSLRDVERRPVLCSFKRIEGGYMTRG